MPKQKREVADMLYRLPGPLKFVIAVGLGLGALACFALDDAIRFVGNTLTRVSLRLRFERSRA